MNVAAAVDIGLNVPILGVPRCVENLENLNRIALNPVDDKVRVPSDRVLEQAPMSNRATDMGMS